MPFTIRPFCHFPVQCAVTTTLVYSSSCLWPTFLVLGQPRLRRTDHYHAARSRSGGLCHILDIGDSIGTLMRFGSASNAEILLGPRSGQCRA